MPAKETVGKVESTLRHAQGERKKSFENRTRTAQAELVEASFQTFPKVSFAGMTIPGWSEIELVGKASPLRKGGRYSLR